MDEFMARILMLLQQGNKIAHCWNRGLVLNPRHLEHVPKKGLEVVHRIRKVDSLVDMPNYGFIS